jgi:hypothetical protein
MDNEKSQKIANKLTCDACYYSCSNKFDYNKHLSTRKHQLRHQDNKMSPLIANKFECINCGNKYKYQSGLSKHKKMCVKPIGLTTGPVAETQSLCELVKELVKSNQDLQKQMVEICKNGPTHNTITTNSHNKSFNLNFFLNEQCKNAINFQEFVENINVSREALANTGQLGFVSGISKILIDHLNELGIHERPIHCTDLKRETVYIKDNNEWSKETDDGKINIAIQEVSRKSMGTLCDWKKSNPDYANMESKFSQDCLNMQRNSLAGYDRDTLYPRVIRELNRTIALTKEMNTNI